MEIDLRKIQCGGWKSSNMSVKVNGRWNYFFKPQKTNPFNAKEPIHFDKGYNPPSYQNRHKSFIQQQNRPIGSEYVYNIHPIRRNFLLAHQRPRAPLSTDVNKINAFPPALSNQNLCQIQNNNKHIVKLKRMNANSVIGANTGANTGGRGTGAASEHRDDSYSMNSTLSSEGQNGEEIYLMADVYALNTERSQPKQSQK